MTRPDFMMSTFIDCTQDALWDALTKAETIARYHFICDDVRHDAARDEMTFHYPNGDLMLSNRVLSADPKRRIELEFAPNWGEDKTVSRCVYLLEPVRTGMKLTVEHYGIGAGQGGVAEGWARSLASLKTFLETGRAHRFTPEAAA